MRLPMMSLFTMAALFASLLIACPAAHAASSIGARGLPLDIELVGSEFSDGFSGTIEVSMPKGPKTLPRGMYRLTGYRYGQALQLRFDNPDAIEGLPPSFHLKVCGQRAELRLGNRSYLGCFAWLDDGSDCAGVLPPAFLAPSGCPDPL